MNLPIAKDFALKCFSIARHARHTPRAYAVLLYHQVVDTMLPSSGSSLIGAMPCDSFIRQMDYVKNACNVVDLDTLCRRVREGVPADRLYLAVTFDDGYKSTFDVVLPVLRRLEIPATFFLTTAFLDQGFLPWWEEWSYKISRMVTPATLAATFLPGGRFGVRDGHDKIRLFSTLLGLGKRNPEMRRDVSNLLDSVVDAGALPRLYMNWSEARQLSSQPGVSIGAHGVSHCRYSDSECYFADEVLLSKAILETQLNRQLHFYAYPFGTVEGLDVCVCEDFRAAGFSAAFTALEGFNHPGDNPFSLRRIPIVPGEPFQSFLTRLYMADIWGHSKALRRAGLSMSPGRFAEFQ